RCQPVMFLTVVARLSDSQQSTGRFFRPCHHGRTQGAGEDSEGTAFERRRNAVAKGSERVSGDTLEGLRTLSRGSTNPLVTGSGLVIRLVIPIGHEHQSAPRHTKAPNPTGPGPAVDQGLAARPPTDQLI